MNLSRKQAQSKPCKSGLYCFGDFLKLLNTQREEIATYFIQRGNSGLLLYVILYIIDIIRNKPQILPIEDFRQKNLRKSVQSLDKNAFPIADKV